MSAIAGLVLDITVTEDHVQESEVTDNPVETGASITDHVRRKADTLTLECVVSDTPIGDLVEVRRREASDEAFLNQYSTEPIDPYQTISDDARAYMRKLMDDREPIVVETATRLYDNMVLFSLVERRTADTGEAYRFTAMFKQVRIVTNDRSTVRVANPAVAKKKKRGPKPTTPKLIHRDEILATPDGKRRSRAWLAEHDPAALKKYDEEVAAEGLPHPWAGP